MLIVKVSGLENQEQVNPVYPARMAAKVAKGSTRKQKPVVTKTTLNSPYEKSWKTVVGDDMQFILQTLLGKFEELGLKKLEPQSRPKKRKGAKRQKKCPKASGTESDPEKESSKEATNEEKETSGWTHSEIRKQLAIGMNEVTKGLEKNELTLVLVCKSVKPEMVSKHLIDLSATREVPTCQLPRLSETVAAALGLRSVLALGFKRDSVFQKEVKAIVPRVPVMSVPWLPSGSKEVVPASDMSPEEDSMEEEGEKGNKPKAGQKRKIKAEAGDDSGATFQGLKVKKIVRNPNKVRKVKKVVKKK